MGPDIQQLAGIPGIRRNVNFFSVEQNANKKTSPLKVQDLTSQKVPKHKQKQKKWQIKALKLFFWQQCLYFRSMNKTIPFQGSKHPPHVVCFLHKTWIMFICFLFTGQKVKNCLHEDLPLFKLFATLPCTKSIACLPLHLMEGLFLLSIFTKKHLMYILSSLQLTMNATRWARTIVIHVRRYNPYKWPKINGELRQFHP